MKRLAVLHLYSQTSSDFLQEILAEIPRCFDGERYRNLLANVAFQRRGTAAGETSSLIHRLGPAWGKASLHFLSLLKRENIQILHTYSESAALWAMLPAHLSGIKLYAHSYMGDPFHTQRFNLKKFFPWQEFQRISVSHNSIRGSFSQALQNAPHQVIVNPLAVPDHLFQQNQALLSNPTRYVLVVEDFDLFREDMPAELHEAFKKLKEQVPNSFVQYRRFLKHQNRLPEALEGSALHPLSSTKGTLREGAFTVHALILPKKGRAKAFMRLYELITLGVPVFVIGDPPFVPEALDKAGLGKIPLNAVMLRNFLPSIFREPQQILHNLQNLQTALKENLSFQRYVEYWQSQYEEMIEESSHPSLKQYKHAYVRNRHAAAALTDAELGKLLACPKCRSPLHLEADAIQDSHTENNRYVCECGQTYPLHNGVSRIYENATEDFGEISARLPPERRFDVSAPAMWRKYFEVSGEHPRISELQDLASLTTDLGQEATVLYLDTCSASALKALSRQGVRIVAVTNDPQIEKTQAMLGPENSIRLVQGNPLNPPFQPATFDLVYQPAALIEDETAFPAFQHWSALLKPHGHLHVKAENLPFFQAQTVANSRLTKSTWRLHGFHQQRLAFLRFMATPLPYPVIYFIAFMIALLQKTWPFSGKTRASLTDLHSTWFRLLAYPKLSLPSLEHLRVMAESAGLNQVHIHFLRPAGYALKGEAKIQVAERAKSGVAGKSN